MAEEIRYPDLADVVGVARKINAAVRDAGLIESAVARPRTTIFGQDAYPDLWTMAAALLHSLVNNHPFIDGNKRVGWIVSATFLYQNAAVTPDQVAGMDQDRAYELVISVADGRLTDVEKIGEQLRVLFYGSNL